MAVKPQTSRVTVAIYNLELREVQALELRDRSPRPRPGCAGPPGSRWRTGAKVRRTAWTLPGQKQIFFPFGQLFCHPGTEILESGKKISLMSPGDLRGFAPHCPIGHIQAICLSDFSHSFAGPPRAPGRHWHGPCMRIPSPHIPGPPGPVPAPMVPTPRWTSVHP